MQKLTYDCICHVCYREFTMETEFFSGTMVEFNGKMRPFHSCGDHSQQETKAAFNRRTFAGYIPQVDDFATLVYPSDRYPYVVTKVSPSGKKVTVEALSTNDLEPSELCNGFPVFDHGYSQEDVLARKTGRFETAYRQGDGSYQIGCIPIRFGTAHYFRNYAD